jgi:putative membrane protein
MYAFALFGHMFDALYAYMLMLTPYTLFVLGVLIMFTTVEDRRLIYWLVLTYLFTLVLEIIGSKTGLIFGEYTYGSVLGVKLLGVPLVIGLNWVIIIWGCILFTLRITKSPVLTGLISAAIAVLFDILLEPVAINFGYWNWSDISVPIQNYIAWFLIAFVFSYFYAAKRIITESTVPIHYFFVQAAFFLALNIFTVWT